MPITCHSSYYWISGTINISSNGRVVVMSWSKYHIQSEQHAIEAELASKSHDNNLAIRHYGLAAEAEVNALNCLSSDKTRTIGITVVSATSLYFMAQDFSQARIVAQKWLATESLPLFAIEELNHLLQDIQSSIIKQNTLNRLLPDGQLIPRPSQPQPPRSNITRHHQ